VFNVGSERENYQIRQIANAVCRAVPGTELISQGKDSDPRNYIVSFAKIKKIVGFKALLGMKKEIGRIKKLIKSGKIGDVNSPQYYNVEVCQ
jgi:nucleoside-diphosphate-sugar epimerase